MNYTLKPTHIDAMCSALELRSEPFDMNFAHITTSINIDNPFAENETRAKTLLQKIQEFCVSPQNGLLLSSEEKAFLIDSLQNLISIDQEIIQNEKKTKCINDLQREIRSASVCISLLRK